MNRIDSSLYFKCSKDVEMLKQSYSAGESSVYRKKQEILVDRISVDYGNNKISPLEYEALRESINI